MDPRLLKYAQANAPRYTSYPTAPHFDASVDDGVFRRWLGELPSEASVSLYLHQPYCRQMCWYCGCHAFALRRDAPLADYVAALVREIDLVAAATGAKSIHEIHWGGGTPNLLSAERFATIVSRLGARFDLRSLRRHAIEIDPRMLTRDQAQAFKAAGVNRASLGVQDLDSAVQAAIGREQPFEQVQDAVARLREAGVAALSFDLMYGLPRQTEASVRDTARRAASLQPARFSVFGYAHVPWFKTRQRLIDETALPDASARLALAEAIRDTLEREGYVAIGYDHYARPDDPISTAAQTGALTRNFQGFVEASCDALIGLGPSAISTLPQGYAQNEAEVGAWRARVEAGALTVRRGRAVTDEDRLRRDIITRLLCDFRIDLDGFGGRDAYGRELSALTPLAHDGLVQIDGPNLTIPDAARPFARVVAQTFDAYRDAGAARHARAV